MISSKSNFPCQDRKPEMVVYEATTNAANPINQDKATGGEVTGKDCEYNLNDVSSRNFANHLWVIS